VIKKKYTQQEQMRFNEGIKVLFFVEVKAMRNQIV
jgi:hypothetical protein